jgi:YD repeat-containing protein
LACIADQPTHAGSAADVQCYTYDGNQRLTNAWTPTTGACTTVPTTLTAASLVTGAGPAPYWQTFHHDPVGNRDTATTYDPGTSPEPVDAAYAIGGTTAAQQVAGECAGTGTVTGPHQVAAISTESDAGTTCQQYTYDAAGNTTRRTSTAD